MLKKYFKTILKNFGFINKDTLDDVIQEQNNKIYDIINENIKLKQEITYLKDSNIKNLKKIEEMNNSNIKVENEMNNLFNSYNEQFETIFLNHKLTPNLLLKRRYNLFNEMLLFINNICDKYGLCWWLNYGSLLGSIRHEGFIPWDDDVDISMMRNDFNIFCKVIEEEIIANGLDDTLRLLKGYKVNEKFLIAFPSLICLLPEYIKTPCIEKDIYNLGFIDIFPFDFSISKSIEEKKYTDVRNDFYINALKEQNRKKLYEKYYNDLNLSLEETEHIIPGIDGVHGLNCVYKFELFDYDKIFPLKKGKFENNYYPIPNDSDYYLSKIYGNYMQIPKVIHNHNVMLKLRNISRILEAYDNQISKIQSINKNFEKK